jgi:hypothetical protein
MRYALISIGIVFFLLAASTNAQTIYTPLLNIVLTKQTPYPVQPGQNLSIEIEIQNSGLGDAENYNVEIIEAPPFKILPGEEKVKTFTRISAKSSVKASWKLTVDPKTISGDYEIKFKLYKNDTEAWVLYKIFVTVQGIPELVLQDMDIEGTAEPNGQIGLRINISNVGTGDARQLKINFVSSAELTPILATGSTYLGELKSGQSKIAIINLSISSTAEYRTYTANLIANYVDEAGQSRTDSFSVGIPVQGSILFDIIDIRADFDRQKIDIDVSNKGTAEAKSVTATLILNDRVVGIDYTSSVKANKKVTFSFPLVEEGKGYLNLTYIGPGLESGQITKELSFSFVRPVGTGWVFLVVIVILAGIVYWFFKRKKK